MSPSGFRALTVALKRLFAISFGRSGLTIDLNETIRSYLEFPAFSKYRKELVGHIGHNRSGNFQLRGWSVITVGSHCANFARG